MCVDVFLGWWDTTSKVSELVHLFARPTLLCGGVTSLIKAHVFHHVCVDMEAYASSWSFQTMLQGFRLGGCICQKHYVINVVHVSNRLCWVTYICVLVRVCMYICIHTYTHSYTHSHTYTHTQIHTHTYIYIYIHTYNIYIFVYIYIYIYILGSLNKFPDFFSYGHFYWLYTYETLNSFESNLLRLQCTCCTVPTTSWRPHGSPRVSVSMTFITASFISSIVS